MTDLKENNVIMFGCGRWAKVSHLPALSEKREKINLVAIVDLKENKENILREIEKHHLRKPLFISLPNNLKDKEVDKKIINYICSELDKNNLLEKIKGAIISTYGLSHAAYINFALDNKWHTLVDKPLTTRPFSTIKASNADKIYSEDFLRLTRKANENGLLFMLATQRRYQTHYHQIGERIKDVKEKSGWPVTFVQAYTNDGWWVRSDKEWTTRSYGSERGGGKLAHTGYHLLDIIPWLMRHAQPSIDSAGVYANTQRPSDLTIGKNKIRKDLGDVNTIIQINFKHKKKNKCIVQIGALHEGFSLRGNEDAPQGRVKHEEMTINQGPVNYIKLRRFKFSEEEGNKIGQKDHLELIYQANPYFLKNYEKCKRQNLTYKTCDSEPTREFLDALSNSEPPKIKVVSPVSDHSIGIKLFSAIYRALANEYNGNPQPVKINFDSSEWKIPYKK